MITVLLVIHLLIALAMAGTILLQRSEGGALGIGGGGGGGGLMTGRAAGNLLTRTTGILAAGFFATSMLLAILANQREEPRSIIEQPLAVPPLSAPAGGGAPVETPAGPAQPAPPAR